MKHKSFWLACWVLVVCLISAFRKNVSGDAGKLTGAWEIKKGTEEQVLIFMDDYFTHTTYDKANKKFIQTRGGTYAVNENKLTIAYEFDTRDSSQVGKAVAYAVAFNGKNLFTAIGGKEESWQQTDEGKSGLSGLWKITARKTEGELRPIHQSGTRKTVKILTAGRFQWAAIDPATKQFMGTGGGSYTFSNGKYTEHIDFFSRDSNRVGSSLPFDGRLENGDWHHSGFSSKGDPIYEVWSRKK